METPAQYATAFDNQITMLIYQIDLRQVESYYRDYHEKRYAMTPTDYQNMEKYASRICSKHTYKFDILPNALKEIAAKSFDLIDCSRYIGVEIILTDNVGNVLLNYIWNGS
jgi:hypothetical protein